ncbi:MAG: hypothetical protein KC996_04090 [Phycisphaerales bacterium]|nr:hypothetical protein [Phycisphaerales bacterium]
MTLSRTLTTLVVRILLAAILPVWMVGCSTNQRFTMPDTAPGDFVLAATVFTPPQEHPDSPASVPARYIVEPDATLRAAVGPGSSPVIYPSPTRTLTSEQFARLWTLAHAIPLDTDDARSINSPENFSPPADTPSFLIEFRANESQQAFAFPANHPQARALIDALADLAWVRTD